MISRRALLQLSSGMLASAGLPNWARAKGGDDRPLAALLLPLVGSAAALSRSLQHAAALAQPPGGEKDVARSSLIAIDSGSTAETAARAAGTAVKRGAPLIIGPLYTAQVEATVAAAGDVPVVTLSNDTQGAPGAFVLGITPIQAIGAILGYARSRGVRRVALDGGSTRWDLAAGIAARVVGRDLGLTITDASPEAVLVTGDADALTAAARRLDGSGVQLLGTYQAMALSGAGLTAIDGAWLAAPDLDGFGEFSRRFEAAFGNPPGVLAGLAYDAGAIARTLRASGHLDNDGLTGSAGFAGVTGTVRFRRDGTATRELSILVADQGSFRTVAHSQAA